MTENNVQPSIHFFTGSSNKEPHFAILIPRNSKITRKSGSMHLKTLAGETLLGGFFRNKNYKSRDETVHVFVHKINVKTLQKDINFNNQSDERGAVRYRSEHH